MHALTTLWALTIGSCYGLATLSDLIESPNITYRASNSCLIWIDIMPKEIWFSWISGLTNLPYSTGSLTSLYIRENNICSEFKSILEEIGFLVLVQTLIISHCPCLFERSQRETSEDCPRYWYLMKIELIQKVIPGLKS